MEDLTGKQFGPYQIVAPLGEGGMAAVYKAYQPSMERYVAVKVLPRQMADSAEFIARFKREAHLLAQLQHPHILSVFDYGQADGYTYIVMPFIQSGTLADVMKTRRMSMPEVRRIVTQVGDALGYAHVRGMIHRDVKPSNVLVDERGNCLLTDFGLARMTEASAKLTSSGAIMGTPAYMSPEQGAGMSLDGRSDIYSLGIIFYEMVTGQVPYSAETPIAIVFKHIQDPLPAARKFVPDLPEEVERVLLKSLAKKPEDRYQTAEDFVHAVQMAIPAYPVAASRPVVTGSPETLIAASSMRQPTVPPTAPAAAPIVYGAPAVPPSSASRPAISQPQISAAKKKNSLWALAGIGVLGACGVGALLLVLGVNYLRNNAAPLPTATEAASTATVTIESTVIATVPVEPTLTPTLDVPPTLPVPPLAAVPPGVRFARINAIDLNPQNQYVVEYETFEYSEVLPGMHVHFFFDTVRQEDAGSPGRGPWKVYGGPRPFTGYSASQRPSDAALMCILVANPNHSAMPQSGNCFPLPDVPTAMARVDTPCLGQPVEGGQTVATLRAGMASRLQAISQDNAWLSIRNPERENTSVPACWVPFNSSVVGGDISTVPVVDP